MSDHAHSAEEPEKDRTLMAVVVIGVALTLALGVWKDGQAAPNPAPNPKLMKERLGGVKVRFKKQAGARDEEFTCVVLERGAARHLLLPNGQEFVIPRSTEIEIVDGTGGSATAKQEIKNEKAKKAAKAKKRPTSQRGQGFVVNHEGEGFVGMLTITRDRILVSRGNGEEVSIPRSDVRWHKLGVNKPDMSYRRAFPNLPVKGYEAPSQGNDLLSKAEIAFSDADWPEATRCYLQLVVKGERQESNLRRAAYQWTGTGSQKAPSQDREQALNTLDVLFRPHRAAHPALTRIQGRAFQDMAEDCLRGNQRPAAVSFAKRLRALGSDFAPAAQKILDAAR